MLEYHEMLKAKPIVYSWGVQCYHYENRRVSYRDKDGRTRYKTERRRINTHRAYASGRLFTIDQSPKYKPDTNCKMCLLHMQVTFQCDGAYHNARESFRNANNRDAHMDFHENVGVHELKHGGV